MIRVCVVAPGYMTGGQAIEARTLVRGFAGDDRVEVTLQPIDPRLPDALARVRGVRTLARLPLYLAGLARRVWRSDVVHIFTAAFWPFVLTTTPAILIARALGKPVILNYRDGRAAAHIEASWVRWVLRRATALVFPSGFLRAVFREHGLDGEVICNVVDSARFRFRDRRPLRPVLISSRLLERLYAVENTLRAFAMVRAQHPAARLVVIGGGDQEPMLRDLVDREGIGGVEFHGAVSHDQVAEWFARADIFVNSSREDNMPHSILEAFSAGLPVVTTAAGGIPWIVEHERNGLLVEIDQPEQLARAVLRLLDDPALAVRLVSRAHEDCRSLYMWETVKRRWTVLYERLLGRPDELPADLGAPAPAPHPGATRP